MDVSECKSRTEPLERALEVIGGKWTLIILYNLCFSERGFNELERLVAGISPRILSLRLKELVDNGLVAKTVLPTTPPQVQYRITEQGQSLKGILAQLGEWSTTLTPQPKP